VKNLDLLKGNLSLVEAGWYFGKSELRIIALNTLHLEQVWFFFNASLLGTISQKIPRV
jgi:hypothetical protein